MGLESICQEENINLYFQHIHNTRYSNHGIVEKPNLCSLRLCLIDHNQFGIENINLVFSTKLNSCSLCQIDSNIVENIDGNI